MTFLRPSPSALEKANLKKWHIIFYFTVHGHLVKKNRDGYPGNGMIRVWTNKFDRDFYLHFQGDARRNCKIPEEDVLEYLTDMDDADTQKATDFEVEICPPENEEDFLGYARLVRE